MKANEMRRRDFMQTTAATAAGLSMGGPLLASAASAAKPAKPVVLGGAPVRTKPFAPWPVITLEDEKSWMDVFHARHWCRIGGTYVSEFEKQYAELTGAKDCIAVANGTSALFTSLNALEIGPGDEVLVPPYTFVATINVVLLQHALPIFVDTDPETFQMDARKVEAAITDRTRCIIPVHLGGNAVDMDTLMAVAEKHNLPVIEDACQSHLAEWRNKKVGTMGKTGCFSFQVTKNLSSGEGGAVISNDIDFMDRCFSFHTNGRTRKRATGFAYQNNGTNVRMTEFQAAILLRQLTRIEEQSRTRETNAEYLTSMLKEIPGILPAKMYDGCTRNAYHLYMFRYDAGQFAGLSRERFMDALRKEGISCTKGYSTLNEEPFLQNALNGRAYKAVYSEERIKRYFEGNHCPENDRLCNETAVWFTQNQLLGERIEMEQIAEAIGKIQAYAGDIAKA